METTRGYKGIILFFCLAPTFSQVFRVYGFEVGGGGGDWGGFRVDSFGLCAVLLTTPKKPKVTYWTGVHLMR